MHVIFSLDNAGAAEIGEEFRVFTLYQTDQGSKTGTTQDPPILPELILEHYVMWTLDH